MRALRTAVECIGTSPRYPRLLSDTQRSMIQQGSNREAAMQGITRSVPRKWLLALAVLAGCATAAQHQAQLATTATREAAGGFKACLAAVVAKPEYASLLPHTPDPATGQPTMAQLTDESLISPEEAKLFAARWDELTPCKTHVLSALSTVRPDVVPVLSDGFAKGAAIAVQLVERKITWGEGARQTQALGVTVRQNVAAVDRQWIADLNASHQAEMARRQAAGAALLQWSAQQQMINAMTRPSLPVYQMPTNRPWSATCTQLGTFVNCTGN